MGRRENNNSSIALLQERFRELQRVKEMRKERQIMKNITQPTQFYSNYPNNNPELIIPSSSSSQLQVQPPQVSLTLWPQSQAPQDHHFSRSLQTQTSMNTSNCSTHTQSLNYEFDSEFSDSGVDTSLHL